jgi:23S rRNA (adenine2503-C2)-methyltransferase
VAKSVNLQTVKFTPEKPSLFGFSLDTFTEFVLEAGFPRFRAQQVFDWLYKKRVDTWESMGNLPKDFRAWLAAHYVLYPAQPVIEKQSGDVTEKLLLQLEDRSLIETVLIRAPQVGVGQAHSRKTVCVSIQVGCAYGCKFCASGLAGFRRNLLVAEVVAQLLYICRREDADTPRAKAEQASFDNIVFMGMGEPLANYETLVQVLRILNAPWGLNFGARRITVSTSGLAPQILKLAQEGLAVRLAISLHGATNDVRNQIMPVNKKYPLEELIPAAKAFQQQHGRMLTLEYILIDGVNDGLDQAQALVEIARELHAHVNCIPYNMVEGLDWKRPSITRQDTFVRVLRKAKVSVTIRREKGHAIDAACGQLRLKTEKELNLV